MRRKETSRAPDPLYPNLRILTTLLPLYTSISIPVRVEDCILFPVLWVALVRREQSTDVVDVDAVGLEDISQVLD